MIRKLQRGAVDASIKVARTPLDTTARLLGRESAEVALDHADAQVRDVAGRLLFDDALREEARLRRVAARERGEALALRRRAEAVKDAAQQTSERHRQDAAEAERAARERIDADAKRERLAALDTAADALDHRAEAAAAQDEALRLKRAADAAKADRKRV
jgi:hypothetical protein